MNVLHETGALVSEIAERRGPSVVGVGRRWRTGSGAIIAPDTVLTAAHNAREGANVVLADGTRSASEPMGVDEDLGIAALRVETGDADPIEWAPRDAAPGIGTPVFALSNPGGRGLRATAGLVAAADRSFRGPTGRRIVGALEHTAPLPRGSAGGPLLDIEGRLLGLNFLRLEAGLILALSQGLRRAAEALARGEQSRRPRLGVAVAPPAVAARMRRAVGLPERDGVLVRAVEDESPAQDAGLAQGDLIVGAGGDAVDGIDALYRALDGSVDGGELALTVVRGTEERELTASLVKEAA